MRINVYLLLFPPVEDNNTDITGNVNIMQGDRCSHVVTYAGMHVVLP
jgi:hypothetical protein